MLISPIDRNKGTEPEKQVSRINSPFWTLPAKVGLGLRQNADLLHSSEGVILRVRDTRLVERRQHHSQLDHRERRQKENRKHASRWNSASHHILVIALERKAGAPELWKAGDRVSVLPKTRITSPKPPENVHPSTETQTNKPPLLTKDDEDYVVHLSGKSPTNP